MNLAEYHAGQYEPQYQYQSFLPTRINHAWVIDDPMVQQILSQADRALGELNAFSQLVPDVDFFIQMYVAKEATYSSRIEGTQTNVEDVFKNAEDVSPEKRDDWAEVQNYIQALNYAVERLQHLPLSNRLLKEVHGILLQGVRGETKLPGEFRASQNWIGMSLKHAIFVPPHHEHVIELMSDLEKFLHDDTHYVSPLIKIAIAHYQFETIHPFLDGNGRLGRLLIPLYLAAEHILSKPALYLSDYFERHKTAYIDHLMAVRQGHHLQEWLVFFLQGVVETAQSSIAVFKSILGLKERIDRDVLPRFSVRRQGHAQQLMRYLYRKPIVDIKSVITLLDTTPNTAGTLINDLVSYGVLVEVTGQRRNRLFVFREYLGLFTR
ncbi:MAG: Fic family protein [Thiothrix sp.]|nr:MAG: Fic family protein [Thiothrix sp.]